MPLISALFRRSLPKSVAFTIFCRILPHACYPAAIPRQALMPLPVPRPFMAGTGRDRDHLWHSVACLLCRPVRIHSARRR